jgi:hypothetical protein
VYHPYSYEGYIDFDNVQDPDMRDAYEVHIREFGQTPRKIFHNLHPKKGQKVEVIINPYKDNDLGHVVEKQQKEEQKASEMII